MKKNIINVMNRIELKYRLNKEQITYFTDAISSYMKLDEYGLTSIESLYFDTPDYLMNNRSLDKPEFKEKLRLRSYGLASEDSPTFLEMKRKSKGIVYKRRKTMLENEAISLIEGNIISKDDQISKELDSFIRHYHHLEPKYLIIYDRLAYYSPDSDLRITIDMNPRYRTNDLNLHTSLDGAPLLGKGEAILELKVQDAIPLWLTSILSKGKIYQTSYSKVGEAHKKELKKHHHISILENAVKEKEQQYGFII